MAQTKTNSSTRNSSSRSGGSSKSSRSGASKSSGSRKTTSQGSRKSTSQSRSRSSGSSRSAPQSSRSGAEKSRPTIAKIAEKAKGPALAGGAALVGLAGGVALNRKKKSRGVLSRIAMPKLGSGISMPKLKNGVSMPKPGPALDAVGKAAGTVAERSRRLGEMASEVQKASDAIGSRSKDG